MKEIRIGPVRRAVQSSSDNSYGLDVAGGTIALVGDERIEFPAGCRRIQLQARLSGDIYAELLTNDNLVGGVGRDAVSAMTAALAKLKAAA